MNKVVGDCCNIYSPNFEEIGNNLPDAPDLFVLRKNVIGRYHKKDLLHVRE